jgi:hypothetical protein
MMRAEKLVDRDSKAPIRDRRLHSTGSVELVNGRSVENARTAAIVS